MKNILIWGFGKSGRAVLNLINKKNTEIFIFDDNPQVYGLLKSEFKGTKYVNILRELSKDMILNFDKIIVSPSIDVNSKILNFARKNNIEITCELEEGANSTKKDIIAVTGTNGKTTSTQLIYCALKKKFGSVLMVGNIGNPLSGEIYKEKAFTKYVCEVSSFQLESIHNFHPHISILLNISPDHLNRHKTMQNYKKIKYRIFENIGSKDFAIISSSLPKPTNCKDKQIYTFGFNETQQGCFVKDGYFYFARNGKVEKLFPTSVVSLIGKHNLENVMVSIIVAKLYGVKTNDIRASVENFLVDAHRISLCYTNGSNFFYDDSKATNLDATLKACESLNFHKGISLILGGSDKGYSFLSLLKKLPDNILKIYAMGEVADNIVESNKLLKRPFPVIKCETLKESVNLACKNLINNEALLLSPGCASFNEFKNYEERGNKFLEYIKSFYEKDTI